MTTYTIRNRATADTITVRAASVEEAARLATRKINPSLRHVATGVSAERVTGVAGKSGIFQAFRLIDRNQGTSVGPQFFVG